MSQHNFDLQVDWLVAGAGAGGMTGAVVAHQLGGDVLVVEKEPVYGGTTAKSGGVIWIPGNHRQVDVGIDDSVDAILTSMSFLGIRVTIDGVSRFGITSTTESSSFRIVPTTISPFFLTNW